MAMSKEEVAKKVAEFKKQNQPKKIPQAEGGGIQHGESAKPKPDGEMIDDRRAVEKPEEEPPRVIPTKQFASIQSSMAGLDCHVISMSMADIVDYVGYAKDLYEKPMADMNPKETWQRGINKKRPASIAEYLSQQIHFLPPIICVPASEGVSITIDGTVSVDGPVEGHASLVALDGQHRRAGIESYLGVAGEEFASETMPVVIITSDLDVDTRQQIFADINRNAKVVSKALNILYDHRDPYAMSARSVADKLGDVVDLMKTVPSPKSSNCCSLSNIENLVKNFAAIDASKTVGSSMRQGLAPDFVDQVAVTVVQSMPGFTDFVENKKDTTYGNVRKSLVCYSSTFFQGIGMALNKMDEMVWEPGRLSDTDKLAEVKRLISTTNWFITNPEWVREKQEIMASGAVGTRREHVARAGAVLSSMWAKASTEGAGE